MKTQDKRKRGRRRYHNNVPHGGILLQEEWHLAYVDRLVKTPMTDMENFEKDMRAISLDLDRFEEALNWGNILEEKWKKEQRI